MANSDHVAILKQGIIEWNQWRANNPEVVPDLTGLREENNRIIPKRLSLGDNMDWEVHRVNLRNANLMGANLIGTELWEANLSFANLHKVRMFEVKLWNATLENACLSESHIESCRLYGAKFAGADLR